MGNNLGEYDNPLTYDAEYGGYQGDFDLFLNLIDQGNVLDLACGTGRLTIPLAQKGLKTTGLEISQPMLERAKEKADGLDIKWLQGDITNFDLDDKFDLITLAGNSFQALLTHQDQQKLLRCIKSHLKSAGLFVFDTRNPNSTDLRSTDNYEYWHSFQEFSGETIKVYGKQTYNESQQLVTYTTKRVWQEHETVTKVKLKYTGFVKLMDLLREEGLQIVNVYGDYQKSAYTPDSKSIIVICSLDNISDHADLKVSSQNEENKE